MDYTLLIVGVTAATGALWALERWVWGPQRRLGLSVEARRPRWIDWTAGLFPVLLLVLVLRSFVAEPFRIPSGSMMPTLIPGDLILVNKFEYGLRLPVLNTKIVPVGAPQRGDVIVFRHPLDRRTAYIKRVVGLPGDEVVYLDKRLVVNGERQRLERTRQSPRPGEKESWQVMRTETLGSHTHRILLDPRVTPEVKSVSGVSPEEACRYSRRGIVCLVPAGHYFVLGDNRDNSLDSRYWGFVPEQNIIGRAFLVWADFKDMKRVGRID